MSQKEPLIFQGNIKKALKKTGSVSGSLSMIPIDEIRVLDGFNVRIGTASYQQHIENIASSIFNEGFLLDKPLSGFLAEENGVPVVYIKDGHTRLEASKIARERGAPVDKLPVVFSKTGNMVDFTVGLIQSNSGQPLTIFEQALVVKRLHGFSLSQIEISRRTGIPKNAVNDYLVYLFTAPSVIHEWIIAEKASVRFCIDMLKKHKHKAVEKIRAAIDLAEKSGQKKATPSFLPDAKFKKFLRQKAPTMTNLISKVSKNGRLMQIITEHDERLAQEIVDIAEEGEMLFSELLNDGEVVS